MEKMDNFINIMATRYEDIAEIAVEYSLMFYPHYEMNREEWLKDIKIHVLEEGIYSDDFTPEEYHYIDYEAPTEKKVPGFAE